jgi:unsaturated rhamnogalacturonyl hydrolase
MWKNVIYPNKKLKCNYYETSGTAMMSYALLKAYNQKILTDEKYLNAGLKAFNGVVESKLKEKWNSKFILKDIYFATNVKKDPQYYCNCRLYVQNDTKGIASLILASTEVKNYLNTQKK